MPIKLLASHKAHMEMSAEVSTVYQQLTLDLAKAHRDYKSRERRNEKDKLIHGSITEQKLVDLEGAKRLYEKLFAAVSGLADATGGVMPALEVTYIPCFMVPCLALPCLALPCLALPCLALHCIALLCPTLHYFTLPPLIWHWIYCT
jgi:hypothetical protein